MSRSGSGIPGVRHLLSLALLLLLAKAIPPAERPGEPDRSVVLLPVGPAAKKAQRAAPPWVYFGMIGLLVAALLVPKVFSGSGQVGSISITAVLTAMTIWTVFGLYVSGTGAPNDLTRRLLRVLRIGIVIVSGVLSVWLWGAVGDEGAADRVAVVGFMACQVASVISDIALGVWRRRRGLS